MTLAKYSPIASSIAADGSYVRAMFGSIAWILPGVAFLMTLFLGFATNGLRTSFPTSGFLAILVAGVLDADIGFAATLGVLIPCVALGTIFSLAGFTMVVIIGALWCGLAVMVGKVRVYLRDTPSDLSSWYVRVGDVLLGSLLCGYLAFKFIGILTGPNDSFAAVHAKAHVIGWTMVGVAAAKYLATSFATHSYPERMRNCTTIDFPARARAIDRFSLALRGLAAFVVFVAFLGLNWMVVALVVLYLIDVFLPNVVTPKEAHPAVRFFIPQNLGKIFALTVISAVATLALKSHVSSQYDLVIYVLLVVMVVAIVNNTAAARWSPREIHNPWLTYSAGFVLATLTILQLSDHLIKA